MRTTYAWWTSGACVVIAAITVPVAAQTLGDVQKVTDIAGLPVAKYPTRLAEIVTGGTREAVDVGSAITAGQAVLTKSAHTHVVMRPGEPETVLSPNTLVRFDKVNYWLMREGAMLIVTQRAKLTLVVASLTTIFVNSQVYVELTREGLLVHVLEGHVVLGATATAISLQAAQSGRLLRGGAPVRTALTKAEQSRIDSGIQMAQRIRAEPPSAGARSSSQASKASSSKGGGGGGKAVAVVLGLGAAGAGVYFLTREDKPDLVPLASPDGSFCQQFPGSKGALYTVTVSNTGKAEASGSTTQLALSGPQGSGAQTLKTDPIAPGGALQIGPFTPPVGCFSPCQIQIDVDSANQINESNEGNNRAIGRCF